MGSAIVSICLYLVSLEFHYFTLSLKFDKIGTKQVDKEFHSHTNVFSVVSAAHPLVVGLLKGELLGITKQYFTPKIEVE